jgi:flagellar basal body-associated protein FliL
MPEPEKPAKEQRPKQQQQEEPQPQKVRLFSYKGLIILVVALLVEALIAGVLMSTVVRGESKGPTQQKVESFPRVTKTNVTLEGPTFPVQVSPDNYRTVQVRNIVVELNSELDETSINNLKDNLTDLNYEIKDALKNIIISEGYQSILLPKDQQRLQNKLRQEIIRLLGGNVSEKEIKAVFLDGAQIGD